MSIETILDRLDKVKPTGRDSYKACCPAHQDKSPSLAIRALDDGRILMKCMAECPTQSVLDAMGLSMEDLFPERLGDFKREKRPFNAAQLLQLISQETTIVAMCASSLTSHPLNDTDRARLLTAVNRINGALHAAGLA